MKEALAFGARWVLLWVGKLLCKLLLDVRIVGADNIPRTNEPLILISNHFSWFDAPLLAILLPIQPIFLIATESRRKWSVRLFMSLFNGIPIWRGQVDRTAFREARAVLKQGGVLGVFPEGGIDPEMAAQVAQGNVVLDDYYVDRSRHSAQLARPRSGAALLAVQSDARILPVGLLGTEKIMGNLLNWRRLLFWRRIAVTLTVGPAFGPLKLDPALRGRAKRQHLDDLADKIMRHIADLFPPEHRGPYRA